MYIWGIYIDEVYASKLTINQFEAEFGRMFGNKASTIIEAYNAVLLLKKEDVKQATDVGFEHVWENGTDSISENTADASKKEVKTGRKKNI